MIDLITKLHTTCNMFEAGHTIRSTSLLRQSADLIEQQQARINELTATVERLLKACELARDSYGKTLMSDPPQEAWKVNQVTAKLVEAIAATPRQNLNAIKREAFIEGFNAGFTDCWIADEEEHAEAAIEIANQRYPD